MESKKISQLATELSPELSDLTIIGDPTTGISKKITLSQMASLFTGTVEEYATLAAFPLVGVADTIYIALDTNIIYRYDTSLSTYVILSPNIINSLVFSDANGFDGTISLVGSVATLSITTALTLGSVPFIGASGALSQDNANLFFDDTNNRLGIATASPTTALDVFGSGIIGRLNATSTNNAYLGFASNGTNKWSAGNVQSDHRFRIFSEANSAELVSVLQTGEFGIGIANPTTKLHIDGGATALIANLDANVSVAKSISFRSDNSNRINLEVSGTESGSNVGADFQIKRFSDAGSLIDTPLSITRSTGAITLAGALSGTSATFSGNVGIGTTSPQAISGYGGLTLNGTDGSFSYYRVNGTNVGRFLGDGANFYMDNLSTTGSLIFTVNNTSIQAMRITSGGQVQFRSYIDFLNGSTSKFIISRAQEILGGSSDDMTLFTQAGLAMQFWTAGGKRMNISSGGYINLNDVVYGNTVNTSPRTLYIENGTGALGGISSIRASKKNIENISNVDWLYQLNPVTFNYRKKDDEGNYTEEIHDYINYGLIAEDTAPIIDFIINYNEKEDGTKEMAGIEYPRLIIPLLKAIQEMNTKINEQNQTIQSLQEQINILSK